MQIIYIIYINKNLNINLYYKCVKLKKFRFIIVFFTIFLLIITKFLPVLYEIIIKENKMESDENGFFAKYNFRSNSTVFYNGSHSNINGTINISYINGHYFIIGSLHNKNGMNNFYYNETQKSLVIRWLLPSNIYKSNSKIIIFNNETENIKAAKNAFGKNEYSGIGIINPIMIYANHTKYGNSFLECGCSSSSSILLYSVWHFKLKPFTDIFPDVNYSNNTTININSTNLNIAPLDIYYYMYPEIYMDIFILLFITVFYYVSVSIAKKNK